MLTQVTAPAQINIWAIKTTPKVFSFVPGDTATSTVQGHSKHVGETNQEKMRSLNKIKTVPLSTEECS